MARRVDLLSEAQAVLAEAASCVGESELRLWLRGQTQTRRIPVASVRRVALTGRDTASGKSYATWLAGYEAKRAEGTAA